MNIENGQLQPGVGPSEYFAPVARDQLAVGQYDAIVPAGVFRLRGHAHFPRPSRSGVHSFIGRAGVTLNGGKESAGDVQPIVAS